MDEAFTLGQLTKRARLGDPRTTRRLLEAGGVPLLRLGRRWAVEAGELEAHPPHFFAATVGGDLQSRQRAGDAAPTTYAYDAFGALIVATLVDGTQLGYFIDPQGRRVGKSVNGKLVQGFIWQSQLRIAAELDGAGNVMSMFVYGTKANVPELIIKSGVTYRVLTDHLGSPRLIVNTADGSTAQRMDFDEWGNVMADSNPGFQPFGFAGGLWDRDLRLVRFGTRDYDPELGRWIDDEPAMRGPLFARANATAGIAINPYAYAANNPINYIDEDGKWLHLVAAVLVVGGALLAVYIVIDCMERCTGTTLGQRKNGCDAPPNAVKCMQICTPFADLASGVGEPAGFAAEHAGEAAGEHLGGHHGE
jgi:RHS repeat-associated protein